MQSSWGNCLASTNLCYQETGRELDPRQECKVWRAKFDRNETASLRRRRQRTNVRLTVPKVRFIYQRLQTYTQVRKPVYHETAIGCMRCARKVVTRPRLACFEEVSVIKVKLSAYSISSSWHFMKNLNNNLQNKGSSEPLVWLLV